MRKRIYRISEDKFDDLKPNIEFDSDELLLTCFVGEEFTSHISFKSTNGVALRGVVYCDNPYIKISEPWFTGQEIKLEFSVDNINFKVGEILSGNFTIVAVGIEKTIPFSIEYIKPVLTVSTGRINDLKEFADFAQAHFTEAVGVFYSDRFESFIEDMDKKTRLLYRGFKSAPISAINVDEFLVAVGQKARMVFNVDECQYKYYEVNENIKGEIEITRSSWGYIDISVTCDADFVSIEKDHITSDYFLGSIFNMSYYVHKERMHSGLNYARISFDYRDIHREITILATADKEGVTLSTPTHDRKKLILRLCRDYEQFRLRRITTGQWCNDTNNFLETLNDNSENENFILLIRALLFITNKQKQEALWIIQDLKRTIDDKRSSDWAFLLYLCTLIEPEEAYVDRLTDNIESIFREHPDDERIFWFLLNLRKEYIKNPSAKLRDIFSWIDEGHDSPMLYVEAYYIYIQDPYLLSAFNEDTLKILGWARKRDALTKSIAIQMIHILEAERVFNPKAMPILDSCYEIYPDLQLLMSIVTYVLKAPNNNEKFLKWYKLAIENNLHISGIFEAYMNAMPASSVEKLPQILTMFFRYNNDLTYDKKALLYANIILHKNEDKDTYDQYERTIETFALEQLKLKRLDDNLAICYQCLMEMGIFDGEVARLISELVFKKKIGVIYPNARRAIMYQEEFKHPIIATIKEHTGYLEYVGSEGIILLEDEEGFLIYDEDAYLIEDILDASEYMAKLHELSPHTFPFILTDFVARKSAEEFTSDDVAGAESILHSPIISDEFRGKLYPVLIQFLRNQNREGILERHFLNEADLSKLSADVIADVLDVFVTGCKYEEAYYMLQHTNGTRLKPEVATKLCQFMINKVKDEQDDFLICLTAGLVRRGQVHGDMIYYLIRWYVGPTPVMMDIYNNAYEKGADVVEFAERIIIQALYRDDLPEGIIDVFDSYMQRKNNRMIVEAFLTYEAHDYLVNDTQVPENVFAYIYNRFTRGQNVNESMRIALLRYLCLEDNPDKDDIDMLDILLGDSIIRNQYFGFFKNCHRSLKIKYHLYDKYFIEYRGDAHTRVSIIYSVNGGQSIEEDMIEMYDGYYVKQFILFFGDELKYEIWDGVNEDEPTVAQSYVKGDDVDDDIKGRFGLMNNIARHRVYNDRDGLGNDLKKYQGLDTVTGELFSMI